MQNWLLLSYLVFLPKKLFTVASSGTKIYKALNLRPLSLSNTFIKLISICLKVKLCNILDSRIHRFQKCISGRSLLDNIINIDGKMHKFAALKLPNSVAIFFDFVNAFPSVLQSYLWAALRAAGLPLQFIHVIQKLYDRNAHWIKIGNKTFYGPTITLGIKQGCPLSMILFALCLEPLLRRMEVLCSGNEDNTVGAFADDIGLVLADIMQYAPSIQDLFHEFASISNLRLNLAKCIVIPLSPEVTLDQFSCDFVEIVPRWKEFKIDDCAEYLGILLGPGSVGKTRIKSVEKASDFTLLWKRLATGFFFNMLATNVFIHPIFSYIAQLCNTDTVLDNFSPFLQNSLFGGPGNWLPKSFLLNMSTFGLPVQIKDLNCMLLAAKARVAINSKVDLVELGVEVGRAIITHHVTHPEVHKHDAWHNHTFVINLLNALRDVRRMGFVPEESIIQQSELQKRHVGLQKRIYEIIAKANLPCSARVFNRFRNRVDRWDFGIPKGHAYRRIITRIQYMKGKVKPAVTVAYFKLLLNAWCTSRRFRHYSERRPSRSCIFCGDGNDSIEHFARCTRLQRLYSSHGCRSRDMLDFFALDQASFPRQFLIKTKLLAAIFFTHSSVGHACARVHVDRMLTVAVSLALN